MVYQLNAPNEVLKVPPKRGVRTNQQTTKDFKIIIRGYIIVKVIMFNCTCQQIFLYCNSLTEEQSRTYFLFVRPSMDLSHVRCLLYDQGQIEVVLATLKLKRTQSHSLSIIFFLSQRYMFFVLYGYSPVVCVSKRRRSSAAGSHLLSCLHTMVLGIASLVCPWKSSVVAFLSINFRSWYYRHRVFDCER